MSDILLEVRDLKKYFQTPAGTLHAVDGLSFKLERGKTLGVVGESGCGKSTTGRAILRLHEPTSGEVIFEGRDITKISAKEMQKLRSEMQIIFQDPFASLNPRKSVSEIIGEPFRLHKVYKTKAEKNRRVLELMELVGIDRPEDRYGRYPFDFSGGMRQRSVMAIALACGPKILFADEPTTALDVTIQTQILDLLRDVQARLGTASVLVTHDLGVVARAADRVAVMYAGRIVETGTVEDIFYDPRHPYTWGLLRSLPAWAREDEPLYTIPGMPPSLLHPPKGDAFACRNEYALAIDYQEAPPMFQVSESHFAATWLLDERAPKIAPPLGGGSNG